MNKRLECKNANDYCAEPYHLLSLTIASEHFVNLKSTVQLCTRTSPLVKIFTHFTHIIEWPLRTTFNPLPASENSGQGGSRSAGMGKTYPNHLTLYWFSACPKDRTLRSVTLYLTFELLTKFCLHIPPILNRQRCSNTEKVCKSSAINDHVLEP